MYLQGSVGLSGRNVMGQSPFHFPDVLRLAFLALALVPVSGAGESHPVPLVTSTSTMHLNFKTAKSFDAVTAAIEKQLGKFDPEISRSLDTSPLDTAATEAKIHAMEGSSGLMLFSKRDHGGLLALKGKKTSAVQYEIGNPLVAVEMTKEDVRAGEYAPVRMYVYIGDDKLTHVDYDLPSSVFGRFKSEQIRKVSEDLDRKVEALVTNAIEN
jgi:uncharacterized protein (DUF302 family)